MARKEKEPLLPGNDGQWFLEVAGVVDRPPTPTATYTELKKLEAPPPVVASESAAATASTAAVSGSLAEDAAEDEFVPVAPPDGDPLPNWEPSAASARLGRHSYGRWVAAGLAVAVLAAIGWLVYSLPRGVQQDADELAASYRDSLTALRNELPTTQSALQILTDPASSENEVAAVVPAIGDLNTRATVVVAQATTPLPETLPLVPTTPLDELEPTRSSMLILGAEAEGISGRLATTFAYRAAAPVLFDTPQLSIEADSATIDQLSVDLAESLAETARLISELPPDPTFTPTRELATSASERYATWQLEYLDALREGDAERAAGLVTELTTTKAAIAAELERALDAVETEVAPQIVAIATEAEVAIVAIP